ncbi:MAG: hypothetical protein HKN17_08230 [Rhodothermales bacterium]|nr:hypothetical protein [Rhodothermales bacterium]
MQSRIDHLIDVDARFSRVRIAYAVGAIVVCLAVFARADGPMVWWIAIAFSAGFIVLVRLHGRVLRSLERHRIYLSLAASDRARIERDWLAIPAQTDIEAPADHPFAADLDLLGERSVHRLIDTSATVQGSRRLAEWLLETDPNPERTADRSSLVRALIPLGPFRNRLRLLGAVVTGDPHTRWHGDALLGWLESRRDAPGLVRWIVILGLLALVDASLFGIWLSGLVASPVGAAPTPWWLASLVVYAVLYVSVIRRAGHLFEEAEHLYSEIERFRPIMLFLERFRFAENSPLRALCVPFKSEPPPSALLRRIGLLAAAAGTQRSELVRFVLNVLMPWDLAFAHLLARYKDRIRGLLPGWLDAWRTLEAACSLASFGTLNPDTVFAEISADRNTGAASPLLRAEALGHPLISEPPRIRNDFRLDGTGDLALITGSNMSGKSTFLRTVGVNLAIAFAGGPVVARTLKARPARIFTCINVSDSVNDGISYFYAEVKRLRALLDELNRDHAYPLLFLVDEIFRGTNNRERLIGSRAFLRTLSRGRGAGLVSTHDLELVTLEDEIAGLSNYHFRESIEDGRMVFDYRLRLGPCPTTNALRIMEMEGLPTDEMYGSSRQA